MKLSLHFTPRFGWIQSFQGRQIVDGVGIGVLTLASSRELWFLPNPRNSRAVAQLVARTLGVREVVGSNPASPTRFSTSSYLTDENSIKCKYP